MRDVVSWPIATLSAVQRYVCNVGYTGSANLLAKSTFLASWARCFCRISSTNLRFDDRNVCVPIGAHMPKSQAAAGLSKTITLETNALTFRMWFKPQPVASALKSSLCNSYNKARDNSAAEPDAVADDLGRRPVREDHALPAKEPALTSSLPDLIRQSMRNDDSLAIRRTVLIAAPLHGSPGQARW